MKRLVLQLLTLYCLVIRPVTGSIREIPEPVAKHPDFIVPKPRLKDCEKIPTIPQCGRNCNFDIECDNGDECCNSICGNICMEIAETETTTKNNKPNSTVTT